MRQDDGFTSFTKPTINNNGGGTDLFVNFTFDTSSKSVYVVYTNDGSTPTKSNGENKTASFSNFNDPNRTWKVTINKAFNISGDDIEYIFYISDNTLANAFGRVTPGGGYQTTWTEGDERGFTYTVHESNDTDAAATHDWSNGGTWNEGKPNSSTLVEIIGSDAINIDENANVADIRIINGSTLNGSDGTNSYDLTISNGNDFINDGTFNASDGKVIFDGDNVISGSTTTTFNNVDISGGVNFGGAEIAGTLDVLAGGFATTGQPPTYNSGSTLQFSTGGDYNITSSLVLWDNSTSGAGVPDNVVINTSELDLQEARNIAGDLTVNGSGNLTLENVGLTVEGDLVNDNLIDFQSGSQQSLTVEGNLTNNNSINLSDTSGGDLVLQGDFTDTATFNTNNRALILTGTNAQSIDANPNNTTIDFLNIDKSGGSLQLTDDLSVTNTLTLEDNNTIDLNLNGNTLSLEEDPTIDAGNTGAIDGSATSSTLDLSGNVSSLPDGLLSGNSIQNLDLSGGTISIDTDLTINNSLNTSNGDHELPSDHILTLNGALNVNSGTFTLRSDSDGSNGSVSAQIANSTGSTFSGDVTVERYVPKSNRAFRYISSPVNTSGTINDNLQEGATTASADPNPVPEHGTHITGMGSTSNGFDDTSTDNFSMFEWDETNQDWDEITSTNQAGDDMAVGDAYALMVRGDRSTTLNSNTAVGPATTLRFTGSLVSGNQAVASANLSATSGNYNLVANPYQAIVDMKALLESADATDLDDQTIYVYDPTLGTQGGYATIDLSISNPTSTPSGTNADENILPNQAFFVETTGSNPALTFKETYKNTSADLVDTFSDDEVLSEMHINLMRQPEDVLVDGVTARFDPAHSNAVNNADADEVWNFDEWVALYNTNTYISIEKRATPQENDTLQIYTGNYQSDDYIWRIDKNNITRKAVLVDNYLDTETPLNDQGETSVAFSIDNNIPESADPFRFSIRFTEETLGLNEPAESKFKVYPNPVTDGSFRVQGLQKQSEAHIYLFDMSGKLVFSTKVSAGKETAVNLHRSLPKGVYQLKVDQNNATYRSTLILSD